MIKAYIILGIGVLLIFLSLFKSCNHILTKLLYLYMFIVFTFCNAGTLDLETYKYTYAEQINVSFWGFDILMNIFSSLGCSFIIFKGFCGLFILFFLSKAFRLFLDAENIALSLGLIFPFLNGISQIKNGMMSALVLYATLKYIKDPKHKILPFVSLIVLASTIHATALVYLIFIIAGIKIKELKKIIVFIAIFMIIIVELIISQNLIYNIVKSYISNEYYVNWFDYKNILTGLTNDILNIKGKLIPVIGQIIGYLLFRILLNQEKSFLYHMNSSSINEKNESIMSLEQLEVINNIFLLLFFIVPFYQLSPTYFRIYRNITPILYIMVNQLVKKPKKATNIIQVNFFVLVTAFASLFARMMMDRFQGGLLNVFESFSFFS